MRKKKQILLEQMERKLQPFYIVENSSVPAKGWVNSIRTSLNMTLEQLGNKLGISRQGVKKIEDSEVKGSASINALKEVAEAMDMKFVYGFVPKHGSLDKLLEDKARQMAEKIVLRTHHNMVLEDQSIGYGKVNNAVDELAKQLKEEMSKLLWE
jgi:predicted DNA-binding mobile mystery protein A